MREITEHRVNPANDKLVIRVTDHPGAGGANHRYEITGFHPRTNASATPAERNTPFVSDQVVILFQNGPINENGVNGLTQEALLAIVADRLRSFQAGPYACADNQAALAAVALAQTLLHNRTRARMARGVEGTHAK